MKYYGYSDTEIEESVMCDDITRDGLLKDMDKRIHEKVDIVIGGPPCQAFSSVGRAQSPDGMSNNPRNYLFENYLQVLNHYKPKMFIFENVKGLLTAKPKGIKIFDIIVREMSKTYNIVTDSKKLLLNAADYGVPQIRERVIIIGVRKDINCFNIEDVYQSIPKSNSDTDDNLPDYVTVGEAISDLPELNPGEGENVQEIAVKEPSNDYLKKISNDSGIIYNHVARKHNDKDRERYRILSEHKNWQFEH